jgi:hypothetical protein
VGRPGVWGFPSAAALPKVAQGHCYIYVPIPQAIYLTFGGTPLSNMVIGTIDFFFASAHF